MVGLLGIEAPRAAIDTVMGGREIVRQLMGNGWLHLFRIDPQTSAIEQHRHGTWVAAVDGARLSGSGCKALQGTC